MLELKMQTWTFSTLEWLDPYPEGNQIAIGISTGLGNAQVSNLEIKPSLRTKKSKLITNRDYLL